jgi:hypothetical protein
MAHRRKNVNNSEAHVKESNEDHGKGHGEQAREQGAHQSRSATPGMQLQNVQAASSRESCGEAPSPRESCEREIMQDGPKRRAGARSVDREVMVMPDWLVFQYCGTQADQDYQHCCSTPEHAETTVYAPPRPKTGKRNAVSQPMRREIPLRPLRINSQS